VVWREQAPAGVAAISLALGRGSQGLPRSPAWRARRRRVRPAVLRESGRSRMLAPTPLETRLVEPDLVSCPDRVPGPSLDRRGLTRFSKILPVRMRGQSGGAPERHRGARPPFPTTDSGMVEVARTARSRFPGVAGRGGAARHRRDPGLAHELPGSAGTSFSWTCRAADEKVTAEKIFDLLDSATLGILESAGFGLSPIDAPQRGGVEVVRIGAPEFCEPRAPSG